MNRRELAAVKQALEAHCGIYLPPDKDEFLRARLAQRMALTGDSTPADYLYRLFEHEGGELHQLINLLTINETYFYRHREQFDILRMLLWERAQEQRCRPLTIWCAACSIGAEPYSIAILLAEMHLPPGTAVRIIGTDIDTEALAVARQGIYSERCVTAELPAALRQRYFHRDADGTYRLHEALRERVTFRALNLRSGIYPPDTDIIFCRNVLIYFREEVRAEIVRRFYDTLTRDGHLFLSPMESLADWRAYFTEQGGGGGCKCYRRWTTDRRAWLDDDGRYADQRQPLDSYPLPGVEVREDGVAVTGIIDGDSRIRAVESPLRMALARMPQGCPWVLDLSRVRYASNDALARLQRVLAEGVRMVSRPDRILARNEAARESFETAGYGMFGRLVCAAAPPPVSRVVPPARPLPAPPRPAAAAAPVPPTAAPAPPEQLHLALPGELDEPALAEYARALTAALNLWCSAAKAGRCCTVRLDLSAEGELPEALYATVRRFLAVCPENLHVEVCCRAAQAEQIRSHRIPAELIRPSLATAVTC